MTNKSFEHLLFHREMKKVLVRKCYNGCIRNVSMLPRDVFRFLKIDTYHSLDTGGNSGKSKIPESRTSDFALQNFTIGFSKNDLSYGYSVLPQHKLSPQPSRTFFSNWSISHQVITRLVLLPCRQRSVRQKKGKKCEDHKYNQTQCLKTSLRAIKSVYSLSYFSRYKQY